MNLQLRDKVIVVSGGVKSINEAIKRVLAEEGAIPVIIENDERDGLNMTEVDDITKPENCNKTIQQVINEFGTIDGLVNNAKIANSVGLEYGDCKSCITSLQENLVYHYLLTKYALPALKISKGSVVNISLKTRIGAPAYKVSNGGINALTREWAVDLLKYNIRVNAVVVSESQLYEEQINKLHDAEKSKEKTLDILLEKKLGTTEEIANVVLFLLSDRSSHTTGQLIHIDGSCVNKNRI